MKSDPTIWILARSSGLAAYVFLTLAVVVGTSVKTRPLGKIVKPAIATDLHRFVALMGLAAVAVHGAALVLDTTVRITPLDLLLPGRVAYRPVWTGAGVVAAELMLVIYVSFSLKRWIGARAWRLVHWATYPLFAVATVHGIMSGTDSPEPWAAELYLGSVALVVFATSLRILTAGAVTRRRAPSPARKTEATHRVEAESPGAANA